LSSDISKRKLGDPFFNKEKYLTYPLDVENFNSIFTSKKNRKIAFIDGGNQELLATPEYSIQINRIYFNIFENNKRIIPKYIPQRIEFLSITSSTYDGQVNFKTLISPIDDKFRKYLPQKELLEVTADEEKFIAGTQAGMERVASMARRFSEWTIAEHIIDSELESDDIIVKDGSLQTAHTNENLYVNKLLKKAEDRNIIFTGLSKTCRLTTDTQISLIASIQRLAEESKVKYDKWCYYPIAKSKKANIEHKAVMMVVKLNKNADRTFRFEILKEQAENMGKDEILDIVASIADNSNDMTFPGYPYGLIDADSWARVKNVEMESYKIQLYSEISKMGIWKILSPHIKAVDAHEKLDEM
jgi:hypothetical protein